MENNNKEQRAKQKDKNLSNVASRYRGANGDDN